MLRLFKLSRRFYKDKAGSTAVEYALVGGLVFLAIVGAINSYAVSVNAMYTVIQTSVLK